MAPPRTPPTSNTDPASGALRRSGAVARMLRMPVATLRNWERRYGLTQSVLTSGGQRLYSEDDVRRLALIRQLTQLGHAIGTVATLDLGELQRIAALHAGAQALSRGVPDARTERPGAQRPWRVLAIGPGLGARLQRPALLRRVGVPVQLLGAFDTFEAAAKATTPADLDAILVHEPMLHAGWLAATQSAAPALSGVPRAVLYGFAADAVCETLVAVGVHLLREPQPDAVVAQWLCSMALSACQVSTASGFVESPQRVSAPRWDDAAIMDFAGRSSTVACECPRHVAELLMQLSHFERYSAACANRNADDARLHAFLQQTAAQARARFETALEQIAMHEGWLLPVSRRTT